MSGLLQNRSILLALALALLAPAVLAQELEIAISPTPIGAGARAAGFADAFVAIADDATAASWNPAGLVQLERMELSLVTSMNGVRDTFFASNHPEFDSTHSDWNQDINYLSFAYPLPFLVFDRNVVVALNYQRKYDFSRDFTADYSQYAGTVSSFNTISFQQEGGLSTLTPAIGFELSHRLSLGIAVNFWRDSPLNKNGWEQQTRFNTFTLLGGSPILGISDTTERYEHFSGENFTLGLLWNATEKLNLGVRYDSAFTGKARYKSTGTRIQLIPASFAFPAPQLSVRPTVVREKRFIRFPDSLAIGAAYRFNDRFTLACDVTRTDWHDFYFKNASGQRFSLVNASSLDDLLVTPQFDPTYTVRLGGEYVFLPGPGEEVEELDRLWSLRAGVFFDQEPASGIDTTSFQLLNRGDGKADDFYGLAFGVGLQAFQRVNIDFAYQFRFGKGVNSDLLRGLQGFEEDVQQHRFLLSTVIYF